MWPADRDVQYQLRGVCGREMRGKWTSLSRASGWHVERSMLTLDTHGSTFCQLRNISVP